MDLPLYTTVSRSKLSDLGSVNYHQFDHAIILDQVMRQAGNNDTQQQFRDILMRLVSSLSRLCRVCPGCVEFVQVMLSLSRLC